MGEYDHIHAACPYREAISRAANNERRLSKVEGDVENNEKSIVELKLIMAKNGLLSGVGGGFGFGAIGLIAFVIGKMAGWW